MLLCAPDCDVRIRRVTAGRARAEAHSSDKALSLGLPFFPGASRVHVHFELGPSFLLCLVIAAVVADRSHWGRLRLSGEGRLAFLHGQSTADIQALQPGSGCDTVGGCLLGVTLSFLCCCWVGGSLARAAAAAWWAGTARHGLQLRLAGSDGTGQAA